MNLFKSYLLNAGLVLGLSGLILTGCGSGNSGENGESGDTTGTSKQDTSKDIQGMKQGGASLSSSDVSDKELKKFLEVSKSLRKAGIRKKYQQKMMSYMDSIGLSPERFGEIAKKKQGGSKPGMKALKGDSASSDIKEVTKEEEKKYQKTKDRQKEMMPAMKKEFRKAVEDQGMDMERFKAINRSLQQDRQLMSRLRKMMMKQQKGGMKGMQQGGGSPRGGQQQRPQQQQPQQ